MAESTKTQRPCISQDSWFVLRQLAAYDRKTPREWLEHAIFDAWSKHDENDMKFMPSHGVYFLLDESVNLVKIGSSKQPYARVEQIEQQRERKLILIGIIYIVNSSKLLKAEKDTHIRFAHLHDHGEWFRAEEELMEWIKSNNKSIW